MTQVLTFACGRNDRTELSASSYVIQFSRGISEYIALPVFLSRSFRFDAVYVRTDRGIDAPADLKGRVVGTPEFQMTAGLWVRGILQDHFGLGHREVSYVTGGLNVAGRKERMRIDPAPGLSISPIDEMRTLNELLAAGEIDAVIAPEPPACFRDGSAPVRRLFKDTRAVERSYFGQSGIFPIMHLVAVRRSLIEASPEIPQTLYDAFVKARDSGYRRLNEMANAATLPLMLPWLQNELVDTRSALGDDFWPYGLEKNRKCLEALCRHSHDQGLSARKVGPDELFASSLLNT
jgi:4,5-dihydroxyphthalate decarboxylase